MDRSDEIWARVAYHRERIENGEKFTRRRFPFLQDLEKSWKSIEGNGSLLGRQDAYEMAENPIAALFFLIDMGEYPPPELLLALRDAYEDYMQAPFSGKRKTLEEVFFGKPRQKAGNFANREHRKKKWMNMRVYFSNMLDKGLTRREAAKATAVEFVDKDDVETVAESILRMFRGITGFNQGMETGK